MVWHPPGPDRPAARPTHPTAHPDHEEHVDSDPNGDRSSDVDQHRRDFLSAVPPTQPRREAGHCHPAWAKSTSAVQCPSRARVLMTGPSARTAMAYRHFLGVYPTGFADRTTHVEQLVDGPTVTSFTLHDARMLTVSESAVLLSYRAEFERPTSNAVSEVQRMYVSSLWCLRDESGPTSSVRTRWPISGE